MRKILKKIITFLKLLNEEFESTCEESYKIKKSYKYKSFKDYYIKFK